MKKYIPLFIFIALSGWADDEPVITSGVEGDKSLDVFSLELASGETVFSGTVGEEGIDGFSIPLSCDTTLTTYTKGNEFGEIVTYRAEKESDPE